MKAAMKSSTQQRPARWKRLAFLGAAPGVVVVGGVIVVAAAVFATVAAVIEVLKFLLMHF